MITATDLTAALLASLEGTRLKAYQDSGGVWTIGTGHTGSDVHVGLVISIDQAAALLAKDLAPVLAMVAGKPLVEAAALASFGYNCGRGALGKVLAGTDQMSNPKYTHDMRGNTLDGLVARRRLEAVLIAVSRQLAQAKT